MSTNLRRRRRTAAVAAAPTIDTLLQYALTGNTLNPTTTGTGLSGGALSPMNHSTFAGATGGYASDPVLSFTMATTSAGAALSAPCYFAITATPDSGKKLNLSSLTFNVARGGSGAPRGWFLRTSVDTYGADVASSTIPTARATFTPVTIDLSGASFQNLSAAVTLRIYCYVASAGTGIDFDDITLTGYVT